MSTSLASTRTDTDWPGRTVTWSLRATTWAEVLGRSAIPTRMVATARWPTQSSTAYVKVSVPSSPGSASYSSQSAP